LPTLELFVKFHAFQIKEHLDYLANLALGDDDIFEGVKDLYNEYLVDILRLFEQSADELPKESIRRATTFGVCAPT
jgi:hypothetical protein